MTIEIVAATLRDVSYIAANMRDDDWQECEAQLPEGVSSTSIAALTLEVSPEYAWVAWVDGQPVSAFGASRQPLRAWQWAAWMFSTPKAGPAIKAVTRHIKTVLIPALHEQGATRVEAISDARHVTAHKWLISLGAAKRCELPGYGRDNETYFLFDWVK